MFALCRVTLGLVAAAAGLAGSLCLSEGLDSGTGLFCAAGSGRGESAAASKTTAMTTDLNKLHLQIYCDHIATLSDSPPPGDGGVALFVGLFPSVSTP